MATPVSQSAASSVNGANTPAGADGAASPSVVSSSNNAANSNAASSTPAAAAAAEKDKFPVDQLKPHINKLLNSKLIAQTYKARPRTLNKEIAESVKAKMLELAPKGFKYIVQVQLMENLGQGGSAFLACHWEQSDTVIQEMFSSDDLICSVFCLAIRDS